MNKTHIIINCTKVSEITIDPILKNPYNEHYKDVRCLIVYINKIMGLFPPGPFYSSKDFQLEFIKDHRFFQQ